MASKTFAVAEKDRYLLKFLRVSLSLDSYYYSSPVYNRVHAMVGMLAAFLSTYKLISTYNSLLLPSVLGFMLCSCSVVSLQLILFYRSELTHQEEESAVLHAWVHTLNLWGSLLVLYSYIALASSVYMQQRL